ncbi:MAG: thioredoxin domain-containing protein [Pseudomonadota bacterium]
MKTLSIALSLLLFISIQNSQASDSGNNHASQNPASDILFLPRSQDLTDRLIKALEAKPDDYKPRTEHLDENGHPRFINRLIFENSPYLIQHAHNPVDWFPWGPEAFEIAQRENKPIFLSIGYSTCHWCHVMERESFESEAIAKVLNRHFIPIKVDRERRPDIDKTYMNAVILMTQGGGWPMSSFLTDDGKPFHGGTYYPPEVFRELLLRVASVWPIHQEQLIQQAEQVAMAVDQMGSNQRSAEQLHHEATSLAVTNALQTHDRRQGGFGRAPKFPQEPLLFLLLAEGERRNNTEAQAAVEKTLDAMHRGGIYDQIGGGFHRYSTDGQWLVPHFEKMLYNQAHLARIYLLAWRLTGNPVYREVATQTLDYVLRDMASPEGAFYSATDADSEGGEGLFFLWTREQIREALPPDEAEFAIELYGISEKGNFEHSNLPHLPMGIEKFAAEKELSVEQLVEKMNAVRERLYQARKLRIHPLRDEKIITAWNGMMISTFTQAAVILESENYLNAATRAAEFIWQNNHKAAGELWRINLHGDSSIPALQQDYAYLAEAMLHLYDATESNIWLERTIGITRTMMSKFWDTENGGFYMNQADLQITGMSRLSDGGVDNAIPSGNSVALRVLQMLAQRTENYEYRKQSQALLAAFAGIINQAPINFAYMLTGATDLQEGELGSRTYVAKGNIAVEARQTGEQQISVSIEVPKGWHINANKHFQKELIATDLKILDTDRGWNINQVSYPAPKISRLGFLSEDLSLYEGLVKIEVNLDSPASPHRIVALHLTVQACTDKVCLAPEKVELRVAMSQVQSSLLSGLTAQ